MNFGEKVRFLRRRAHMTQAELAKALDVSLRTVTNYETGGRYPKSRRVYSKIASVFGVDPNYLLTEGGDEEAPFTFSSDAPKAAGQLISEARALFSGPGLSEEQKDETMRALQDVYWAARDRARRARKEAQLQAELAEE